MIIYYYPGFLHGMLDSKQKDRGIHRYKKMGNTIWVDVEGRAENDLPWDNSIMLRLDSELDRLSELLNVARISDFYDFSVVEQALREDEDEDRICLESWYEPANALSAVKTLREHLEKYPQALQFIPDPSCEHWFQALLEELQHCQNVLESALSRGKKFRFLIVP